MSRRARETTVRRAYAGARQAVIPAFGVGAIVGLLSGIPIVMCAGTGAMLGIVLGAMFGLCRS